MYSWYAPKYYYKEGDPQCELADQAIANVTKDCGCKSAQFHRVNMVENPPVDKGCEFTNVPTFVYHGEKIYEAKGDETLQDWERIISLIVALTKPSSSGIGI